MESEAIWALFRFQTRHNPLYARYLQALGIQAEKLDDLAQLPFLPVRFFKQHLVSVHQQAPQQFFLSSSTTGRGQSRHPVYDRDFYLSMAQKNFEHRYGSSRGRAVLALLPSYLERGDSSLVAMAAHFISLSGDEDSGFFLNDLAGLAAVLRKREQRGQASLLLGVTFALLDLAEAFPQPLKHTVVMETGGMKGRRKEMVRAEVHQGLKEAFGQERIHSEYGMTELFSQAYSSGEGRFQCPPWMQVRIRESEDPFQEARPGKTGGINVIDLANAETCAFLETEDLGRRHSDGTFEVLGRFDQAEIRGCNLLAW